MRIAHVFWSFAVGGIETMAVDLINKQIASGLRVDLVIINNVFDAQLLSGLDARVRLVQLRRKPKSVNVLAFVILNQILSRHCVIHCHSHTMHKILAPWLHRKLVLTVHGFHRSVSPTNPYFAVVAVSRAVTADLYNQGVRNLITIPNGVETRKISRKTRFNRNLRLCCIGRLDHSVKGQDVALLAFAEYLRRDGSADLFFVGEGMSRAFLADLATELGVSDHVFFLGNQSREEIYASLRSYDISMQLSLHEGFGLAALESMVAGVPLITSSALGLLEIANDGEFSWVSRDRSVDAVVEQLLIVKNAIESGGIHFKLKKGFKFARENYGLDIMHERYLNLYGLVGTRRSL